MSKPKKLVTHNGSFHADDLFACATLVLLMKKRGEDYEIIRTRDKELIALGDIVFDVGGMYDPGENRFDHHQKEGAGARDNGIPYSSFGLVWKHYGREICDDEEEVQEAIDRKIACSIDAIDNGVDIVKPIFPNIFQYNSDHSLLIYSPTWKEAELNIDKIFVGQVEKAAELLSRHIKVEKDDVEGKKIILESYKKSEDPRIIELPASFPRYLYQKVLSALPEPVYLLYQSEHTKDWRVEAVTKNPNTLESRKLFPESWRGFLTDDLGLKQATGVEDVLFCHRSGFYLGVRSKEGAYALAKKALES